MTTLVDEILAQENGGEFSGNLVVLTIPHQDYVEMDEFKGGNPIHEFYKIQSATLIGGTNFPYLKIEAIPLYLDSETEFINSLVRYHSN